jgi:hypothetical protein
VTVALSLKQPETDSVRALLDKAANLLALWPDGNELKARAQEWIEEYRKMEG